MDVKLTFQIGKGVVEEIDVEGVTDLLENRAEFMARLNSAIDRMAEAWENDDDDAPSNPTEPS